MKRVSHGAAGRVGRGGGGGGERFVVVDWVVGFLREMSPFWRFCVLSQKHWKSLNISHLIF